MTDSKYFTTTKKGKRGSWEGHTIFPQIIRLFFHLYKPDGEGCSCSGKLMEVPALMGVP